LSEFCTLKQQITEQIKAFEGVSSVDVHISVNIVAHGVQNSLKPISNIKNIIAVASGKGYHLITAVGHWLP
jgi:ATP-binding protein involved in chromosome partitioning